MFEWGLWIDECREKFDEMRKVEKR